MNVKKIIPNEIINLVLSKRLESPRAVVSPLWHLPTFSFTQKLDFSRSMLIFSVDVDVGNRKLGLINKGQNDKNVNDFFSEYQIGKVEEIALPLLLDAFNAHDIPVTFALRGQLTEVDDSFLPRLLDSSVKHDIGAHGYYHRSFTHIDFKDAENELNLVSSGFGKYGIHPKTFVFPRNGISYLDLLYQYGYRCYRENGDFLTDGMYIARTGLLFDVHPSLYLSKSASKSILQSLLLIAINKRAPLHFWCHPWSFGMDKDDIQRTTEHLLVPFFKYALKKQEEGLIDFDTMLSSSKKAEDLLKKAREIL